MKVALVAHRWATRAPTGIDRYARELLSALTIESRHAVIGISTREPERPMWAPQDVEIHHVPGPRRLVQLAWLLARRPPVDRWTDGAQVVHVTAPTFPVPTRAPLVVTVHDLLPLSNPEWFDAPHRWGFRAAMAHARTRASEIIADSETTAEALVSICGIDSVRITVIPLGVPPPFLQPVEDPSVARLTAAFGIERAAYIVAVGQVTDRKNISVVVEALARMGDDRPTLVVAGPDGPGARSLRALVDARRLTSHVRFVGFVSDDDLPALVAGARALVHPSLGEGFGLPPLEAMALGVPAVISDAHALPSEVADLALAAPADDPDAWAHALATVDDDAVAARAAIAADRARAFTWARTARETSAVYERVAGDARE